MLRVITIFDKLETNIFNRLEINIFRNLSRDLDIDLLDLLIVGLITSLRY